MVWGGNCGNEASKMSKTRPCWALWVMVRNVDLGIYFLVHLTYVVFKYQLGAQGTLLDVFSLWAIAGIQVLNKAAQST